MTTKLPPVFPGHWDTPDGQEMADAYANMTRSDLAKSDMSDLALANRQYMADRSDLDLLSWQTAAKERIRWLSVQLAIAHTWFSRMAADKGMSSKARRVDEALRIERDFLRSSQYEGDRAGGLRTANMLNDIVQKESDEMKARLFDLITGNSSKEDAIKAALEEDA